MDTSKRCCKPKTLKFLYFLVAGWQLSVFLLAAGSLIFKWGSDLPPLSSNKNQFLYTLVHPNQDQLEETLAIVARIQERHLPISSTWNDRTAVSHLNCAWRHWEEASDNEGKIVALEVLGDIYFENGEFSLARMLYLAAIQLASYEIQIPSNQLPNCLTRLADLEEQTGNLWKATLLCHEVVENYPNYKDWHRCVVNRGILLRECGYPAAAEKALAVAFTQNFIEKPPLNSDSFYGPYGDDLIKFILKRFRFKAVYETALTYSDRFNFPAEYFWKLRAAYQISPQVQEKRLRFYFDSEIEDDLFLTSLKAGPVFVLVNSFLNPVRLVWNGAILLVTCVAWWLEYR